MTTRAFAVPPGTGTLTMSPRVISEPSWYLMARDETQRDRDKPRQGVVANTLNLFRGGAVGFIACLDHTHSSLFHWDDTYRISPKAITPPITILIAFPPVDGAVPMLTRYIRQRISALIKRIPSTAPHFFIVKSDKPPRL